MKEEKLAEAPTLQEQIDYYRKKGNQRMVSALIFKSDAYTQAEKLAEYKKCLAHWTDTSKFTW